MHPDPGTLGAGIRLFAAWAVVLGAAYPLARCVWHRRPALEQAVLGSLLAVLLVSWWGYVLAGLGVLGPGLLILGYGGSCVVLGLAASFRISWRGPKGAGMAGGVWLPLALLGVVAFFVRWHDPARHLSLGGNDPWGHLSLAKAVWQGDVLLPTHYYSFYPRGFHFLTVAVARTSGSDLYEVYRLSGPILAVYTLLACFCLVRRIAGALAGSTAAAFLAVPPFRHWVLACAETAVEPDRLAFGMLACVSLLALEMLDRARTGARYGNTVALVVGGWVALFLVHPLSVELGTFLLTGMVVVAVAIAPELRRPPRLWIMFAAALAGAVVGAVWYAAVDRLWGVRLMPHLSDPHALTLAGHGLDLRRLLVGTGFWGTWEDIPWLLAGAVVLMTGLRRRSVGIAYAGIACLLMGYSALTDALYLGDYGHAPPYYAVAQSWAFGVLAGLSVARAARRSLRLSTLAVAVGAAGVCVAALAIRWPPPTGRALAALLLLGAAATGALRPRVRRLGGAFLLCSLGSLWALSPRYAFYPHLGYEENVKAALRIARRHGGEGYVVYSQRLASYTASGDAFPILNREEAIVEPRGTHAELEQLLVEDPSQFLPTGTVYVFLEKTPFQWVFHAFDTEARRTVMLEAWEWMDQYHAVHGIQEPYFEEGDVVVYRL
jgi:hypothetical protein